MNDQQMRDLFTGSDEADEPPLSPGYVERTVTSARTARRRRRIGGTTVGGIAAVAVLALAAGVLARPAAPSTTEVPTAAQGAGRYDPLVSRIDPGWLPSGWNGLVRRSEQSIQTLDVLRSAGTEQHSDIDWGLSIYLLPPGVGPADDGPLEGATFGHGHRVAPVQGMRAEELPRTASYVLEWRYDSGAHAAVEIPYTHKGTREAFGEQTAAVARRIAETLGVDGNTALRFPFTVTSPSKQRVAGASTGRITFPNGVVYTTAAVTFSADGRLRSSRNVSVNSHTGSGGASTLDHGRTYLDLDHGGFTFQVTDPGGRAEQLARSVDVFGDPTDLDTWRTDPLRP